MLEDLRKEIDACDNEIIAALKKRMEVSSRIGKFKKENNLPIYNKEREQILLENLKNMSNEFLSKEAITNIYKEILKASKDLQNKLF